MSLLKAVRVLLNPTLSQDLFLERMHVLAPLLHHLARQLLRLFVFFPFDFGSHPPLFTLSLMFEKLLF